MELLESSYSQTRKGSKYSSLVSEVTIILLSLQTGALRIRFPMISSTVSALQTLINHSKNTIEMTAEFITSTLAVFVITRRQTYTFPNCE